MSIDFQLFGTAWLAMLLAAIPLACVGIFVVARGHILLAVAASQSAACGAACAMFVIGYGSNGHTHGDLRIHAGAIAGGLLGTALSWSGAQERAAWLFVAAGAGTILLVANSPYGMHDVLALQHSHALVAGTFEAITFFILMVAVTIILLRWHRPLRLLVIDPAHAKRCGIHTRHWHLALGAVIGLVLSLGVSVFGLLYTFSCLILPALIGGRLIRTFWPLLLVAPIIAILGVASGIIIGHSADLAPGQSSAAMLAVLYPFAALVGRYVYPKLS